MTHKCHYCAQGVPHAPHTCNDTSKQPQDRGIKGEAVNHWWSFSACGAAKDEKCRYAYPVYCTTHQTQKGYT